MRLRAMDLVDVLVYLVVIGLFVQFLPGVISESFLASLGTAILMKIALEGVVLVKNRILVRVRASTTRAGRIVSTASLMVLSGGSKFVILWLTDVVLGDAVYLGGFFAVTLLIITLIAARAGVRSLFEQDANTAVAAPEERP